MNTIVCIGNESSLSSLASNCSHNQTDQFYCVENIEESMQILQKEKIDCILIDALTVQVEALKHLKKSTSAPLILLIDQKASHIIKTCLLYADDYMTFPLDFSALYQRIQARILQYHHRIQYRDQISFPPLQISLVERSVYIYDKLIDLTASEYDILVLLASNPRNIVTISEIYQSVWKMPDMERAHTVQVHIANLRKKLSKASNHYQFIQTVWGKGYRFTYPT